MTKKESIFYFFVVPIFCALIIVFGSVGWKQIARWYNWMPPEECPGFPIKIDISSPGNGAEILYIQYHALATSVRFFTKFTVTSSRKILDNQRIGLILYEDGQTKPFVFFPDYYIQRRNVIMNEPDARAFKIQSKKLNIMAILAENPESIGSNFGSLEQIKNNINTVAISTPISVTLKSK